jgi:nitrogen fixation protein NifB
MVESIQKNNLLLSNKILNTWFESISLPVAPTCNMMCNFCMKDRDCISNGNNPEYLSRTMTPRQAVNWAKQSVDDNKRIKIIDISGPGEPLYNVQTFETLKRLNIELPHCYYRINTNGLLLSEKINELVKLNIRMVNVSICSISLEGITRLYSRIVKDKSAIARGIDMANSILKLQYEGIKSCTENGINVGINTICIKGVNDHEILEMASKYSKIGVNSMHLISTNSNRSNYIHLADLLNVEKLKNNISPIINDVEIKVYN